MFNYHRPTYFVIFIITLFIFHLGTANCAAQQQTGTLTGTLTNPENKPINADGPLLATGVFINLQKQGKDSFYNPGDYQTRGIFSDVENERSRVSSNRQLGGLYTFANLKPGVYNLVVEGGVLPDNERGGYTYYRPQRIVGIVVKPGQETIVDIVMHPGDKLEQSGDPKHNTLEMVGEPRGNVGDKGTGGWIEGTITNSDGQPVLSSQGLLASGVVITFKKSTGETGYLQTDRLAGGFYSCLLLTGTYTLIVEKGRRYENYYRPLIISGVVIKPGMRNVLNIILKDGDALERVSAPQMETQPVVILGK